MTRSLLGPIHRHTEATRVTLWMEVDAACDVEVRVPRGALARATFDPPAGQARTFEVAGHHYAVVVVEGLTPGEPVPYEVWLTDEVWLTGPGPGGPAVGSEPPTDGAVRVWPEPGRPPSLLRPVKDEGPLRLVFGSCRVTAPQEQPYTLNADQDSRGLGTDALHALALELPAHDPASWPDVLLLLGDQVYADHVSSQTAARIRDRRDVTVPPGEEIADFEEYTWLYQEAWSQTDIRWLLSTVPTAMIFDDHDVRDDWNISAAWRTEIRAAPWWDARVTGGIMAYWLYQHLGNLAPAVRECDPVFRAVVEAGTPAVPEGGAAPASVADSVAGSVAEQVLRAFARRADEAADHPDVTAGRTAAADGRVGPRAVAQPEGAQPEGHGEPAGRAVRWSFRWDLGRTRLIVIDSRCARVVSPDGSRAMIDAVEWEWVREQTLHDGEVDHLLLGTSVPFLLTPTIHNVEAASELIAGGRWGRRAAAVAERVRQALDLEHWSAFGSSFAAMAELLRSISAGERGPAPASVIVLSGDVHHAYLARADFPAQSDLTAAATAPSPVWQAVCSPFRNPLGPAIRRVGAISRRAPLAAFSAAFARLAGVRGRSIRWTVTHGPWFDSQLAVLELDGRAARFRLEKTEPDGAPGGLDPVLVADLAPAR
ncbi:MULTISPECIES: DUF7800 domain-containing protein [unclassified Frankia]